jgi:hypothetical protein
MKFGPSQDCTYLSRHDALPLGYERAFGAHAVAPPAVAFVALEGGDDAVVPAPGALRGPRTRRRHRCRTQQAKGRHGST